jgi:ferredoxin
MSNKEVAVIVQVDRGRCTGHARCAAVAPSVYQLDDDGYCAPERLTVPAGHEGAAAEGAASCPEAAIGVRD